MVLTNLHNLKITFFQHRDSELDSNAEARNRNNWKKLDIDIHYVDRDLEVNGSAAKRPRGERFGRSGNGSGRGRRAMPRKSNELLNGKAEAKVNIPNEEEETEEQDYW